MNNIFYKALNFLKNYFVVFFLTLIFAASSYAIFHSSFFHVHDFTHAARIAEMARGLDQGQFPVRWSENFGYGFGMPLFNFYAPLPYFVGAIFFKFGFNAVLSIKILYLLVNFLTLLGAFLLGKKLFGRWGGLLLSASYTLAPYRAVNLFVRGALSEVFAMAFLPLVLYGIIGYISKKDKKYLLLITASLFAIILSHNLTALIFIPMAGFFTFVYLIYKKRIELLWPIFLQFLLAFFLSAFYILPAFMEKDLTVINRIFGGYFHYSNHFLYIRQFFQDNWQYGGSSWGPNDDISFFLGKGQIISLLVLIVSSFFGLIFNFKKFSKNWLFFLTAVFSFLTLFSLLMSLLKSQLIWDNFTLLQFIQFPWRFLSAASFFIAVLTSTSAYLINAGVRRNFYATAILFILLLNAAYFKPESYLDNADALYYTDVQKIQNQMSETLPDYIPKQMANESILLKKNQELPDIWLEKSATDDKLELMLDYGTNKMASIIISEPKILNFKVAFFAGWQAEIDGEKQAISVNEALGNIQVAVPSGNHKVAIYFTENTFSRKFGDILSAISLIIAFYFFYPFAKNRKS